VYGKSAGHKTFGRNIRGWEDNIEMDLKKIGGWVYTGYAWLRIGTGFEFL
jgi:hypothetical protein